MNKLKVNGSYLVPGFSNVEGIVVDFHGIFLKQTFLQEETAWKGKIKKEVAKIDVSHLLQPLRLEKLLSRDSKYKEEYPKNISKIVYDYAEDLLSENQIENMDIIKDLKKTLYKWIRLQMEAL